MIKLTNEEKLRAGVAVLQGDQFERDNALLFMIDNEYCALQMIDRQIPVKNSLPTIGKKHYGNLKSSGKPINDYSTEYVSKFIINERIDVLRYGFQLVHYSGNWDMRLQELSPI